MRTTSPLKKLLLLPVLLVALSLSSFGQWNAQTSGITSDLEAVHFFDADNGIAGGESGNYVHTTDGGMTWSNSSVGGTVTTGAHMTSANDWYFCGNQGGTGVVYKTTDGGVNWSASGLTPTLNAIWFTSANNGYVVGSGGAGYRTTNAGASWAAMTMSSSNDYTDVHFPSATRGYAVTAGGEISRTTNGGTSWTNIGSLPGAILHGVHFSHPDSGYVVGASGYLRKTFNGGSSWFGLGGPQANADIQDIYMFDFNTGIFCGLDNTLKKTTDSWAWLDQAYPAPGPDSLNSIWFANDSCGWIVGTGGSIYKTCSQGSCEIGRGLSRDWACRGDTIFVRNFPGWNVSYQLLPSGTPISPGVHTADTSFVLQQTSVNGFCTLVDTFHFSILYCDSVWPGDANADGVADFVDLLNIGIGAGATGPVRPGANNSWTAQFCPDWTQNYINFSGPNYKHGDCDGNGTINVMDTLPLSLNFGLTHMKGEGTSTTGSPEIWLDPLFDSLMVGDTGYVDIYLGKNAMPIDSLYGLAWTITYDNALIDTNTVGISYANSWFGTNGTDMVGMAKDFWNNGECHGGLTGLDHIGRSGMGRIATMSFVTIDNISGKTAIKAKTLNLGITAVTAVDADGGTIQLSIAGDSIVVWDFENALTPGIDLSREILVYPNPTTDQVNIVTGQAEVSRMLLLDLSGRLVRASAPTNRMDMRDLPNGVYFLRFETEQGIINKKIVKTQ